MPILFKIKKFGAPHPAPVEQAPCATSALVLSLGGNLLLAGVFLRALLNPIAHVGFIVQTGIWIFLVEFFSIFVSGFDRKSIQIGFAGIAATAFMFFAIALFAFAFGWLFLGNIYLPLIFLGSTLAKIFGKRAVPGASAYGYAIPLLVGSTAVVFLIGPEFWVNLFPFPENFYQYQPADWVERIEHGDISGEFVERPQTMLVWGIIYFVSAAIIELTLYRRSPIITERAS